MAVVNEARHGGGAAGLRRRRRREMGGGGGGGLIGYLSNIANYPMALPYKTLLIIKLLNHN